MSARHRLALLLVLGVVLVLLIVLVAPHFEDRATRQHWSGASDPIATLGEASGWLGRAMPADSLRRRVVLLLAWSDTDPLSMRLLREADAWQQAYGRFGLRVVGVHVPEFAFSADSATPARARQRLGVRVPVALDAGSRLSSRLGVGTELPVWIVVGRNGRRAWVAEGERSAEVQHAVLDALSRPREARLVAAQGDEHDVPKRVYCGTARASDGPLAHATPGEPQMFTTQFRFQEQGHSYTPYPVGRWTPSADGVTSARGGASDFVAIRYDGGSVDAVMGANPPSRVWVMCDDGWLPVAERGDDVKTDARGGTFVDVAEPRPYSIVRSGGPHVLRLSPEGSGVTYYVFAFGAE